MSDRFATSWSTRIYVLRGNVLSGRTSKGDAMQNITLSFPDDVIKRGKEYARRRGISLNALVRDALILACAEDAARAVVFSEDLSSGQRYGGVRVANPFGKRIKDLAPAQQRGIEASVHQPPTADQNPASILCCHGQRHHRHPRGASCGCHALPRNPHECDRA